MVTCDSPTELSCFQAYACTDNDGLNRCSSDSSCPEETFPTSATWYAECGTDLSLLSNSDLRIFGEELKAEITNACATSNFKVREWEAWSSRA